MSTAAGSPHSGKRHVLRPAVQIGVSVECSARRRGSPFCCWRSCPCPGWCSTQFWRANRDSACCRNGLRTPGAEKTRRYLTLFLSVLCLYSCLFYPWMMLMECAKASARQGAAALVAYVYMARGFSNALLRWPVRTQPAATDCIRSRLLCALPDQPVLLLQPALPVLFHGSPGSRPSASRLVITSPADSGGRLTNPAESPAGLVLMNLAFSLWPAWCRRLLLSIVTDSLGGNFLPAFVCCCAFAVLGVLLSLTLAVRLPCGGGGGGGGGDAAGVDVGGGGTVSENETVSIDWTLQLTAFFFTPATLGGGGGKHGGAEAPGRENGGRSFTERAQQPAARMTRSRLFGVSARVGHFAQKPLGKGMDNKVQQWPRKQRSSRRQQQPVTIPAITVMSGIEMQNKYVVRNSMGQQVYYAKECGLRPNGGEPRSVQPVERGVRQRELQLAVVELHGAQSTRIGLGGHRVGGENAHLIERRLRHRFGGQAAADNAPPTPASSGSAADHSAPFELAIEDNMGNELFSCCKCCFDEVTVEAPPGVKVGKVTQVYGACQIRYNIIDERDNTVFIIDGPSYCKCYCPGDDIPFNLFAKDSGLEIGRVSKQWSNLMQEYFTDADNFGIAFPLDLDVKLKGVVLGACFLIDFMFFEQGGRSHH
uniref:Phospholipid scramblase n=1 Tax=Macrostomum lignano TaxID=282301 RepID=A0A1I8FBT5_9PLAT